MLREEKLRKVLDKVLWTHNASDDNKNILVEAIIEVLEQEPCEDVVSRQAVIDMTGLSEWFDSSDSYNEFVIALSELPSVTPQETRWVSVTERLPEEHICDDGFHEPSKSVLVQMKSGAMHTARYWSRYDERWLDLNYPTTDEVIAWMPLPKQYKEDAE